MRRGLRLPQPSSIEDDAHGTRPLARAKPSASARSTTRRRLPVRTHHGLKFLLFLNI